MIKMKSEFFSIEKFKEMALLLKLELFLLFFLIFLDFNSNLTIHYWNEKAAFLTSLTILIPFIIDKDHRNLAYLISGDVIIYLVWLFIVNILFN